MRKHVSMSHGMFNFNEDKLVTEEQKAYEGPLVGVYVRIPLEMKKYLHEEAAATGNSMSGLVRHALRSIYQSPDN